MEKLITQYVEKIKASAEHIEGASNLTECVDTLIKERRAGENVCIVFQRDTDIIELYSVEIDFLDSNERDDILDYFYEKVYGITYANFQRQLEKTRVWCLTPKM